MKRIPWIFASVLVVCFFIFASIYGRTKRPAKRKHNTRRYERPYYYRHRYSYRRNNRYPYFYFFPFVTIYGQRDYYYYGEVPYAPPPMRREGRPRSPGPEYVWVPGNWAWNDRWIWVEGEWVVPPRDGAVWQSGYWTRSRRGYVWVQGRWRY
jgi:hypothetical protein